MLVTFIDLPHLRKNFHLNISTVHVHAPPTRAPTHCETILDANASTTLSCNKCHGGQTAILRFNKAQNGRTKYFGRKFLIKILKT